MKKNFFNNNVKPSNIESFLRKNPLAPELLHYYGLYLSNEYGLQYGKKYIQKAIKIKKNYKKAINDLIDLYLKNNLPFSAIKVLKYSDISQFEDLQKKLSDLEDKYIPEKVTFYIPVYNVEKYIKSCIENILRQTYPIYEILIINDATPDNSIAIAEQFRKKYPDLIKIIHHKENKGLAAVRNTAIENAKGNFLATINTDAIPDETFLEIIMMEFLKDNSEKIGGIGGKLLEQHSIYTVDRCREVLMRQHYGDEKVEPQFLFGSTSVFRLSVLKEIGGFNPIYKTNFEDCDISNKIKNSGYKLLYLPNAIANHQRQDTLKTLLITWYNWVSAAFKPNFFNLEVSKKRIVNHSFPIIVKCFEEFIQKKRFHLLYPLFLSVFLWPIKDILQVKINENEKVDTIYLLCSIYLFFMNKVEFIPYKLKKFILKDIESITNLCGISKKVESIVRNLNENNLILKLKNIYPDANLEYASKISETIVNILSLEPIIFNMLRVSRERIAYEEFYEKKFINKSPKIMILNPPWRTGTRYGVRAGSRWPFTIELREKNCDIPPNYIPYPFFLGYTTSLLKEHGFNTIFVDAIAEGLLDEEFFQRIKGFNPDLILMETATASIFNDINYVRKLKSLIPDCKIILSGTHVSHFKESFLLDYPCVDGIIIGEVEEAFLNIVKYFEKNKTFDNINQKGFLYFNKDGEISGNSERTDLVNIDNLPYPERLTLPVYNYEDLFAGMEFPSLQIHASRGCPYGCIYCVWPQVLYQSRSYRTRDPVKVVDEIEEMVNFYGYRSFYFDDDTFNIGKVRILKICEEIKKRGLNKIPWAVMARADTSDFETLKAMKDAGLISIKFGVESASQQLIDACGKGLDLRKVEQTVKWCKELGIQFHLTFTFGLPGETKETIEKTIQYAMELAPDTCQFSLTTPFPGTKYFEIIKKKGLLLTEEWDKFDGARFTVIRGENLTKSELEQAVADACRRWKEFKKKKTEK